MRRNKKKKKVQITIFRDFKGQFAYYNQAIKSRRLRWLGHVARMEEDRSALKILTGNRKETFRKA